MTDRDLSNVDPQWAWADYVPSDEAPWNRQRVSHLLRRAAFGGTPTQIEESLHSPPTVTITGLLKPAEESTSYRDEIDSLARSSVAGGDSKKLSAWWLHRLLTTPHPLLEVMTLFWHGHFATSATKVTDPQLMLSQNELLRGEALGDFGAMVQQISRDPAMLIWLDSVSNRKAHPNENYAREVMELFCLGEGNYSEQDIRELARCFTGWEVRNDRFRFNPYQHDDGTKTLLGESGNFGGEEGTAIVLNQASCPEFIAGKLVRQFCFEEPVASPDLIAPLAKLFRESDLQIEPVVRRILSSNLFFSSYSLGRRVRSPIEFAVGLMRSLEGSTNVYNLSRGLAEIGQELFYPPNVKGWDGGRTWINSSTLLGRSNLVTRMLASETTRFNRGSLSDWLAHRIPHFNARQPEDALFLLAETLCAVPVSEPVRVRIAETIKTAPGSPEQQLRAGLHLLCSLAEFQLC